ncbi:MAG: hypothetical protein H7256_15730 [Bdellovibrio sp.]|nr:hypothetical protein [Bdellovibrio sp.]
MKPANQLVKFLNKSFFAPLAIVLLTQAAFAFDGAPYPKGPELETTPGVVCTTPTEKRYPEQIDYCSRDVSSGLKNSIIAKYDQKYGYQIQKMKRGDFKIDHFIPLSIGGANAEGNLWPQHKSVYGITDPIELELSILISAGKIKQADAIRAVKEVKEDLSKADAINKYLHSLE